MEESDGQDQGGARGKENRNEVDSARQEEAQNRA